MIAGGCLCGAVRYRSTAEPIATRICWCRVCQYLASNGTVNVVFPRAAVTIEGATIDFVKSADSGAEMHRRFCPTCGTQLFSEAASRPHLLIVRAGTLDDRELARPSMAIWTAQAPSWACMNPDWAQLPGQPPPAG